MKWMYQWTQTDWEDYLDRCKRSRPTDRRCERATTPQRRYLRFLNVPSNVVAQLTKFEAARTIDQRRREQQEYEQWRARKFAQGQQAAQKPPSVAAAYMHNWLRN